MADGLTGVREQAVLLRTGNEYDGKADKKIN